MLVGLPADAIASGTQGQLGLGATYFAANQAGRSSASIFVKQALIRLNDLAAVAGQSLAGGRMELVDGTEVAPKQPTLAALKHDRIAHTSASLSAATWSDRFTRTARMRNSATWS